MARPIDNPLRTASPPSHWTPADCASRGGAEPTLVGNGRWLLESSVDRRTLLKGASATALAALAAACAPASGPATPAPAVQPTQPPPPTQAPPPTAAAPKPTAVAPQPTPAAAQPTAAAGAVARPVLATETVFVFNVGSRDVTLIDAAARSVIETKPLGAQVRWLSNEQTYWDGSRVWTYDFPDNRLQAIAIDPQAVAISSTISDIGTGPGHSLVVLPGGRRAAVNVAGDNVIALLDLPSGQVESTIKTGAFPWDLDISPDGRFGYTPERDADTVSKIDLTTGQIVKTVNFPSGSQPWMLRVSHDGKEVWVQTGTANTNVVLDAEDLRELATEACGRGPVTNAWTPDSRYSIVTNSSDTFAQVFDARTYKEVKRLNVGQGGANIGFSRDGKTGFISVSGANAVAVVDMDRLEVASQIRAGSQPTGLIVL